MDQPDVPQTPNTPSREQVQQARDEIHKFKERYEEHRTKLLTAGNAGGVVACAMFLAAIMIRSATTPVPSLAAKGAFWALFAFLVGALGMIWRVAGYKRALELIDLATKGSRDAKQMELLEARRKTLWATIARLGMKVGYPAGLLGLITGTALALAVLFSITHF